jgi:hypothetical protein
MRTSEFSPPVQANTRVIIAISYRSRESQKRDLIFSLFWDSLTFQKAGALSEYGFFDKGGSLCLPAAIPKASRLIYLMLYLPANISSEPFNMVTRKIQFDASSNPPLDGYSSDEDMSLGGASHKSSQSGLLNSSSLQIAISRSKSQEAAVFFGVENCRVFVRSGGKHNNRQYVCGKPKVGCALKGHQALQKISREVGNSGYYQPATSRTGTVLDGYTDSIMHATSARKLEESARKANWEAAARATPG